MSRRRSRSTDGFERRIETALRPFQFIGYGYDEGFVSDLEEVEREIAQIVHVDPGRAVALYELFLASAYEKAEEVDDSDGMFAGFVGTLFCGWVRARQAATKDPDETATLLLRRMDEDPYGFAYGIEHELTAFFDGAGLAAFERAVQQRIAKTNDRHWAGVLRAIFVARRAVDRYIELAERTDLSSTDCLTIARMLVSKRKPDAALSWVERGIAIGENSRGASHELPELRRALLVKLGRAEEAADDAWSDYRAWPSCFTYETVMRFATKTARRRWHRQAMDIAVQSGDLASVLELWTKLREDARLIERLRTSTDAELEAISHYVTEPVAGYLDRDHPEVAVRLHRALGMRILAAKKSAYYYAALDHFEYARRCYARAGMQREWDALVETIRRDHFRKSGFMPGFEHVVRGRRQPGLQDRARESWKR